MVQPSSEQILKSLCPIMCKAGDMALLYAGRAMEEKYKADTSLVTEADNALEEFLLDKLSALFPEASFLAEESGESGAGEAEYQWVIDPLDGTTNFVHGFPYYSISVALTQKNKPVLGAVYNPLRSELFSAHMGGGAYLNGEQIRVSRRKIVSSSLVSFGTPCPEGECDWFWERVRKVTSGVHSYRKLGSASLDMANVAAGRLDAALFGPLKWWDIAAGMVIVREAGGKVSEFAQESIAPGYQTCLVTNGLLHTELQKML